VRRLVFDLRQLDEERLAPLGVVGRLRPAEVDDQRHDHDVERERARDPDQRLVVDPTPHGSKPAPHAFEPVPAPHTRRQL
jgi:hypothetical protein